MVANKNTQLLPAYLADGEDLLKRSAVVRRLRSRIEKEGDLAFNSDSFDGTSAEGEALVTACKTLPFASEKRLVTVNSADKLAKKAQSALVEYLKEPNESTVLLLISDKLSKNSALYKAVKALGASAIIDCTPPKKKDLANQVRAMAPSHGITITPKAASALVELVGEDTVHLDAELGKLASAQISEDSVTEEQVREMVARVAEAKPWEFVNAFSARDLKACIYLLGLMPSASPYALLRQCVGRLRELMCAKSVLAKGGGSQDIARSLGVPDWKVKNHIAWSHLYTSSELRHAVESSLETERKMKGGSVPETTFKDWVISVVSS